MMVGIFNSKYTRVHFTKTQIQNKEKDLKRDYRMSRDARKQSGVGWNEHRCMIQAEPHLWDNLEVSFGNKIRKFRTEDSRFPLYDLLGELYESQIAEGDFNFTSMVEPPRRDDVNNIESDGEFEDERELEKEEAAVQQTDDELQMLDQAEPSGIGGAKTRPKKIPKKPKRSPKKSSGDALVGGMQRFVEIKEKESKKEEVADFSITRCMIELKALEGVTPDLKVKCYGIFKCPKNCEIFINVVADNDGSALAWLRSQIGKFHIYSCVQILDMELVIVPKLHILCPNAKILTMSKLILMVPNLDSYC